MAFEHAPNEPHTAEEKKLNPWLKLVLELGPLLIFFFANARGEKLAETWPVIAALGGPIFFATACFIVSTVLALAVSYAITRRLPLMPFVTAIVVVVFGGLTLWLHDATFIKMKPTIIYLLFGGVLLGGLVFGRSLPRLRLRRHVQAVGRGLAQAHLPLGRVLPGARRLERDRLAQRLHRHLGRLQGLRLPAAHLRLRARPDAAHQPPHDLRGNRRLLSAPAGLRPLPPRLTAALAVAILAAGALALAAMHHPWICACGTVKLWYGGLNTSEGSQHLTDWYSWTHIEHGLIFYLVLWLVARRVPLSWRFVAAVVIEVAWEIVENSPWIIDRYRAETISLNYFGDSIVNSLGDVLSMMLGFLIAWRLPAWFSIAFALAVEVVLAVLIRDNLTLNVIMLLYPHRGAAPVAGGRLTAVSFPRPCPAPWRFRASGPGPPICR